MCGAAPRLAAACCLCQLPLHHYKACRGSAGKHKQKIFTKFCCCFGGWGWCFDPHLQLHLSNCLCENIYHLPWTFPMCSVLVSADLRTLVPVHTRRSAARTLAAFLSYCGEQPTTLPPSSLPPLAAPAPSRGTCRHHTQQLRQARWRCLAGLGRAAA